MAKHTLFLKAARMPDLPAKRPFGMARETIFLVQAFKAGKGVRLIADTPIRCKSLDAARKRAKTLATAKAGVVAFATSGDAESGEYDEEPVIVFRAGRLPPPFDEA